MRGIGLLKRVARKCMRLVQAAQSPSPPRPAEIRRGTLFVCNVCGTLNCLPPERLTREDGHCERCGCYGRLRSIVHAVTTRFSPDESILADMAPRKSIRGVGCSDWGYCGLLAEKFDYVNTFYDHEPQLDLCNVDWARWKPESVDFITCTDVLEHVEPPIERIFENVFRLLKPGGAIIVTVPTSLEPATTEHFHDLHYWAISGEGSARALVNRRRDGAIDRFESLCFHGGEGMTLEFRLFSRQGLIESVERAGLRVAAIREEPVDAYAIPLGKNNFVLVAEKPGPPGHAMAPSPGIDAYKTIFDCQEEIAARRNASGPDPCRYAERYRHDELGYWVHIPRWMLRDFGSRQASGEAMRCLDVGCAYGTLLLFAKKAIGGKAYAVDSVNCLDPSLIRDYGIEYRVNNIEREEFPWQARFDVVLFTEILEHLNFNALPTLVKLRKLLAPGGRLYLSTPDAAEWGRQTKYYARYRDLPMPSMRSFAPAIDDHVWRFDETELNRLVKAAGFRVARSDLSPGRGMRHFNLALAADD